MPVKIVTDSVSDISSEVAAELGEIPETQPASGDKPSETGDSAGNDRV